MIRRGLTPEELSSLEEVVGGAHVVTAADELTSYTKDWTRDLVHAPAAVVKPRTTEEVSRLLGFCDGRRIPVTPQGGRTGMSGGALAVHGGVALSLERMNTIREIDTANFVAVAEAGVVTQTLQEAVEEKGLFYPPDPSSRGSCLVGGNVAENAGGPHAAKYGVTGKWVLGLEAVFADGRVTVTGGKTRKDVAGYDLTSLLVGSEGTLAVVTAAWLRLITKPAAFSTVLAPFGSLEEAARGVVEIHRAGLVPSACEVIDRPSVEASSRKKGVGVPFPAAEARILLDFDGGSDEEVERDVTRAGEILLEHGALDVALATDEAKRRTLWEVRRGIAEAIHDLGVSIELDVAVPRSELVALVEGVRRIAT
ncbi:MAG TPA: FAD-binding protein, partial [Thermoanaerobaculia bacterium]|nr:FAD-binding protein [Thermoanaerobaculia bacterium]